MAKHIEGAVAPVSGDFSPPIWGNIPKTLADRPQWLLWRYETTDRQSKPLKVPYWTTGARRGGTQGGDNDRAKLVTLVEAQRYYERGNFSGVGFAFLPGDGLIGIDIDGAIDPETGEVSEQLQAIIAAVNSYTEFSPSGQGAHIITLGDTVTNKSNDIGLEIFTGRQYFTFTGKHWSGTPLTVEPIDAQVLRRLNCTVDTAKAKRKISGTPLPAANSTADLRTRVESALGALSPDLGYNDWIAIGWALREAFGDFGFGLWNAWSARGEKYQGDKDLQSHWKSFTVNRAPDAAVGVIFARARDAGWKASKWQAANQPAASSWDYSAFDDVVLAEQPAEIKPSPWPEPMIPGTLRTPDFPEDILPGVWGEMARAVSASTQTPPALAVMCCLGVIATLLQGRYGVSPFGTEYFETGSLFVVSASPSGTRKTAVLGAFLAPLLVWEKLQYDRYRVKVAKANAARSTAKKRIEHLNQQAAKCKDAVELATIREDIEREELEMPEEVRAPRLFTGDTTAERLQAMLCEHSGRMAVHSDEPGIFRVMAGAYSGGSQNLDVFLQGHAGSAIRVDRAGRMAHIDKPALTFNLMIQPGLMSEIAGSKGFRDSGLLARFLFAVPATNVGKRDVRKHTSIGAAVRDRYEAAVMALLEGYLCEPGTVPAVRVLELNEAAREHWLDFSQYIEDRQGDGGEFESIRDWTSKLAGAVARIAALLELARVGLAADVVQFDSMDDAIRLAKVLIPHAHCAFGLLGTDAVDVDAQTVLRWARGRGEDVFTQREAQKAMQGRFTNVERLKKAMERLTDNDCVRPFRRTQATGRPSACYRLNPALL